MKQLHFIALISLSAFVLSSCDPVTPTPTPEPQDTIPASFPKKHLIEEFTGQDCGYCPYGMDCIQEFVGNDTNWVLVLHHQGYAEDHFSIADSKTIVQKLGVKGAPQATVNRAATEYTNENGSKVKAVVLHPAYLGTAKKSQFDETTYASINIENSYDAATRELQINISGAVCRTDVSLLNLTVMVKESGMIDYQSDYLHTFEGWQEFRHANAVRAILTDVEGDLVAMNKQRYNAKYTLTLGADWVPENCMVVAFLSEDFKPVIQAEQKPVVAGTQGGASLTHGGITPVPVPAYYPEPDATSGPGDVSGEREETMTEAYAWYSPYSDVTYWQIQAYNVSRFVTVNKTRCVPFAFIYVFTEPGTTTLPEGTYPFATTTRPGTAFAGFRNDSEVTISGSIFYFTDYAYLQQGYLREQAEWLMTDGSLNITADGWTISSHALNGSDIKVVGTTPISNQGRANSPAKMPKGVPDKRYAIEYCK